MADYNVGDCNREYNPTISCPTGSSFSAFIHYRNYRMCEGVKCVNLIPAATSTICPQLLAKLHNK